MANYVCNVDGQCVLTLKVASFFFNSFSLILFLLEQVFCFSNQPDANFHNRTLLKSHPVVLQTIFKNNCVYGWFSQRKFTWCLGGWVNEWECLSIFMMHNNKQHNKKIQEFLKYIECAIKFKFCVCVCSFFSLTLTLFIIWIPSEYLQRK